MALRKNFPSDYLRFISRCDIVIIGIEKVRTTETIFRPLFYREKVV